jgi:signal peptidase I
MSPLLSDGDEVLFEHYINQTLNIGDILLFNHPYIKKNKLAKRITKIKGDSLYFLEGHNSINSSDSKTFGYINKKSIIAIKNK